MTYTFIVSECSGWMLHAQKYMAFYYVNLWSFTFSKGGYLFIRISSFDHQICFYFKKFYLSGFECFHIIRSKSCINIKLQGMQCIHYKGGVSTFYKYRIFLKNKNKSIDNFNTFYSWHHCKKCPCKRLAYGMITPCWWKPGKCPRRNFRNA